MSRKYTKEELEQRTLKGKEGEKGLIDLASSYGIDTNGLNKDPMIKEILKAQGKTEAKAETPADGLLEESKESKEAAHPEKVVAEHSDAKTAKIVNEDKTDTATGEPVKGEYPLPVEADEEKQAADKYTKEDKEEWKFVEKGILPDTIDRRAAAEGVAPIEIARRRAAEYQESVDRKEEALGIE